MTYQSSPPQDVPMPPSDHSVGGAGALHASPLQVQPPVAGGQVYAYDPSADTIGHRVPNYAQAADQHGYPSSASPYSAQQGHGYGQDSYVDMPAHQVSPSIAGNPGALYAHAPQGYPQSTESAGPAGVPPYYASDPHTHYAPHQTGAPQGYVPESGGPGGYQAAPQQSYQPQPPQYVQQPQQPQQYAPQSYPAQPQQPQVAPQAYGQQAPSYAAAPQGYHQGPTDAYGPVPQAPARAPQQPTAPRADDGAPPPIPMKIVISGGFGVGKTTFVSTISDIVPLTTEAAMTGLAAGVDNRGQVSTKTTTTVAMDFGRVAVDQSLVLYLFGTPGQDRFGFMWDDLVTGALGAMVMVDTRRLEDCFAAVDYFEDRNIPFVVLLNRFDGQLAHAIESVRAALQLDPEVPVTTCDARDRESVKDAILALLDVVLARALARAGV